MSKDEFERKVTSVRNNSVAIDSSINEELIPQVTTLDAFDFMILCGKYLVIISKDCPF